MQMIYGDQAKDDIERKTQAMLDLELSEA